MMTSSAPASSDVPQISTSEELTLVSRGYRLMKKLGEGSYAKVYLTEYSKKTSAKETPPNLLLACKIIDTVKASKDFVRKFLPRELEILAKLNHPHVILVHSIFQRRTKYFIFMRYAENGDLLDFVLKNGAIAEPQARIWFRQLGMALQYLHEMEIAHRDLKCENILISSNFNVKIADFGFAREVVDSKGKRVLSETYCGSLSYAAPEILRGHPYNPKVSDIWACGVILFIMLNKAMPFDDANAKKLYDQQVNRKWKFRTKVIDVLSVEVKTLVSAILDPDVTKRVRLEHILNGEWIAMDERLLIMSAGENEAQASAADEKMKFSGNPDDKREDKSAAQMRAAATAAAANKPDVTVIKDCVGYGVPKSEVTLVPQPPESTSRHHGK